MDVQMEQLDQQVHRARALYRERRIAARRCGCGCLCVRCRTGVRATSKFLQRALTDLDQAQELYEQRAPDSRPDGTA